MTVRLFEIGSFWKRFTIVFCLSKGLMMLEKKSLLGLEMIRSDQMSASFFLEFRCFVC